MIKFTLEDIADLRRWLFSGAVVVVAYGGIGTALVAWQDPIDLSEPGGAIVLELAPVMAAPAIEETELPPGPLMEMSDASPNKPTDNLEEKREEKEEVKVEVKVAEKVEAKVESKPVEEPPPEAAPAVDPEVAVAPPAPQEVKQETPQRQEPRPPAPTTSAPQVVPDQVAAIPVAPRQAPNRKDVIAEQNWTSQMLAIFKQNLRYPSKALARGEKGVAYVFFAIDREGKLLESRIQRSSGIEILDEEALATIRRSSIPAPPPSISGERISRVAPLIFILK
jgi:periplasmic protein TonB